jgi:hypothetical protein
MPLPWLMVCRFLESAHGIVTLGRLEPRVRRGRRPLY